MAYGDGYGNEGNGDSEEGIGQSIKSMVWHLLDKNALLTPKLLCALLKLPYKKYSNYVKKLKYDWKHYHEVERGSKGSLIDVHAWRGFVCLPRGLVRRGSAEGVGWVLSRSRNRFLLWVDRLGRMQWFETDRVNLYVRKPATLGKAYQLFCNGFVATSLITDIRVMEGILREVKFKSAHFVFETKVKLPQIRIDLFDETHGIKILVGDRTHPHSLEIIASYMNWAERFELALEKITKFLEPEKRSDVRHEFEDWYVR